MKGKQVPDFFFYINKLENLPVRQGMSLLQIMDLHVKNHYYTMCTYEIRT